MVPRALVGQVAKRQAVTNPENTVLINASWAQVDEVNKEMKMVPHFRWCASNADPHQRDGRNIRRRKFPR